MVDSFSPAPYNQQVAHSKRLTSGILSIVLFALGLGWIGIPKFMLGYNKAGLITLIVSIGLTTKCKVVKTSLLQRRYS